jgi:predicted RNase H-like HicB family nuclease
VNSREEYGHYSVIMEWDPEDRVYVVTVPELPGCMTHGATLEEAARQAKDAIESWIDAAREWGRTVPEPSYFDVDSSSNIGHSALGQYKAEKVG